MTKFISTFFSFLFSASTAILPRWKRLTCKARLYNLLEPFDEITINGKKLKFFIPNRTCVYWVKNGPHSEPATNNWINSLTSTDVFVDIGANIGLYSLMAGVQGVAKVYAIEANPFSFSVLTRNIIINELSDKVVALCMPISEVSSILRFSLSGSHAGSIGNEIVEGKPKSEKISITTASFSLDGLLQVQGIFNITHLKIDVDGIEKGILRGATNLLSSKTLKYVLVEDVDGHATNKNDLDLFMERYDFVNSIIWGQDGSANKIFMKNTN